MTAPQRDTDDERRGSRQCDGKRGRDVRKSVCVVCVRERERERERERGRGEGKRGGGKRGGGVLRAGGNEIWGGMNAKRVKISDERGGGREGEEHWESERR